MSERVNIQLIKNNFDKIKTLRSNANKIFSDIENKIKSLDKIYIDLIQTHKNIDFTFGLDSFHFQNKLIEIEYENIKKIFSGINNRMYGEYYKLHKMIQEYIAKEIKDAKILEQIVIQKKQYPVYKDLEVLKSYDFNLVVEMQKNIVQIIHLLSEYLNSKETELATDSTHSEIGINIENIINYQHYANALLSEKIVMFSRYLDVFHKHHNKYLSRLVLKSKMMLGIVNEDINLKQGYTEVNKQNINKLVSKYEFNTPDELYNNGSTTPTSVSSIDREEEKNIKKMIGYENSDKNIQDEFNNIIGNLPQVEEDNIHLSRLNTINVNENVSSVIENVSSVNESENESENVSLQVLETELPAKTLV